MMNYVLLGCLKKLTLKIWTNFDLLSRSSSLPQMTSCVSRDCLEQQLTAIPLGKKTKRFPLRGLQETKEQSSKSQLLRIKMMKVFLEFKIQGARKRCKNGKVEGNNGGKLLR